MASRAISSALRKRKALRQGCRRAFFLLHAINGRDGVSLSSLLHENLACGGCAVAETLTDDVDAVAWLCKTHTVDGEYLGGNHFGIGGCANDSFVNHWVVCLGEFTVVEEEHVVNLCLGASTCLSLWLSSFFRK